MVLVVENGSNRWCEEREDGGLPLPVLQKQNPLSLPTGGLVSCQPLPLTSIPIHSQLNILIFQPLPFTDKYAALPSAFKDGFSDRNVMFEKANTHFLALL